MQMIRDDMDPFSSPMESIDIVGQLHSHPTQNLSARQIFAHDMSVI